MTRRILVADDSKTIQTVVDYTFRTTEFEVFAASNAEEARAWLAQNQADVILADVDMPKMDGYKLCDEIRTNEKTKNIPVLLLGGAFESIDETRAQAVRASGHIQKPFDSQELIDHVSQLCGLSSDENLPSSFGDRLAAKEEEETGDKGLAPPDLSQAVEVETNNESLAAPNDTEPVSDAVAESASAALGKVKLKRLATQAPSSNMIFGAVDSSSRAITPDDSSANEVLPALQDAEGVVFAGGEADVDVDDSFDIDAPIEFAEAIEAEDEPEQSSPFDVAADDLLEDAAVFEIEQDVPISDDMEALISEDEKDINFEEPEDLVEASGSDLPSEEAQEETQEEAQEEAQEEIPSFGAPVSEIMAAAAAEDLAAEQEMAGVQAQWAEQASEIEAEQASLPSDEQEEDEEEILEEDLLSNVGPVLEPPPLPAQLQAAAEVDVDVWSLAEPVDEGFSDAPAPPAEQESWVPSESSSPPDTNVPTEIAHASVPPVAADFTASAGSDSGGFPFMPRKTALGRDPSAVVDAAAVVADAVAMVTERGVDSFDSGISEAPVAQTLAKDELIALAREAIEKVAWEVVPELAETIIRSELNRLLQEQARAAEEEQMGSMQALPRQHTPPPPPPPADD
jgi:CheY-like chemotaxis protein